jgi:tetratricopeptide (TPR) repeat protein
MSRKTLEQPHSVESMTDTKSRLQAIEECNDSVAKTRLLMNTEMKDFTRDEYVTIMSKCLRVLVWDPKINTNKSQFKILDTEMRLRLGMYNMRDGDLDEAYIVFTDCLIACIRRNEKDKLTSEVYFQFALCHVAKKETKQAVEYFQQAHDILLKCCQLVVAKQ